MILFYLLSKTPTQWRDFEREIKYNILEVRPNLYQSVSVATIKIINDLKIYDFCCEETFSKEPYKTFDLQMISREFSPLILAEMIIITLHNIYANLLRN